MNVIHFIATNVFAWYACGLLSIIGIIGVIWFEGEDIDIDWQMAAILLAAAITGLLATFVLMLMLVAYIFNHLPNTSALKFKGRKK